MTQAGKLAEALAERFLKQHGLVIKERNFRSRGGEIDLICREGAALVFVEVRLRRSDSHGGAAASITAEKQRRIVMAARRYLAGRPEQFCRFDALLLDALDESRIEWIRDAFAAE